MRLRIRPGRPQGAKTNRQQVAEEVSVEKGLLSPGLLLIAMEIILLQ